MKQTAVIFLTATAGLLLLAGCGSGSPSPAGAGGAPGTGSSANTQRGLAYSACMRSHGVARYPDASRGDELPSGLPKVSLQQLAVSGSVYQAAQRSCAHLLPHGGRTSHAQSQQDLQAMRGFARCMRTRGVPTWPDPSYDPTAGWGFNLVRVRGFNPNSQQIDDKMTECARHLPAGTGVPLARPGRPG